MGEHNNLVPHPALRALMERLATSADRTKGEPVAKPPAVSVFGRARTAAAIADRPLKSFDRLTFNRPLDLTAFSTSRAWEALNDIQPEHGNLIRNRLFPNTSDAPAAAIFDVLRTRMLHSLAERGWRRIGITSPTPGCGKSFVAANLALSLARRPSSRTVLLDLDLCKTDLARAFGQSNLPPLADFLSGDQPLESVFCRFGTTLALGLNCRPEAEPSAILHSPDTAAALDIALGQLAPEVMLIDLPPALGRDDVIALKPHLDAVLLVTDGRHSQPGDIRACEALFEDRIPILGAVLNRGEDAMPRSRG